MIHDILKEKKVILASASPRRTELFKLLGVNAHILPADIAEPLNDDPPEAQAMHHARSKATHIYKQAEPDAIIVAADTLVAIDNHVLGKPGDISEAKRFLKLLSGRWHSVFTGLCIIYGDKSLCAYERTEVQFASLSDTEIDSYITTHEPLDKAGAYGIQGYGAQFIVQVQGCYFNVMGFPIRRFYAMLQELLKDSNI